VAPLELLGRNHGSILRSARFRRSDGHRRCRSVD
jgi:hypothetical protein